MRILRGILDTAQSREYVSGLVVGLTVLAASASLRRLGSPVAPVAAVGAAAGGLLVWLHLGDRQLVGGLILVAAASLLPERPAAVVATIGVVLVALSTSLAAAALAVLLAPVVAAGGSTLASLDARAAALMLAVTLAAIWVTVPDTEEILAVGGALTPVVAVGVAVSPRARLRTLEALPVAAVLLWAIAQGGRGRSTSIIGATASTALFLLLPVAQLLARRRLPDRVSTVALTCVHTAIALAGALAGRVHW